MIVMCVFGSLICLCVHVCVWWVRVLNKQKQ